MTSRILSFSAVAAALALAGCGSTSNGGDTSPVPTATATPTTGTLAATWTFAGTGSPTITIDLLNGATSGVSCANLPFTPTGMTQSLSNLSQNGTTNFTGIAPGSSYVAVAFGTAADGTRLAQACHDQINILAGQTTNVDLGLEAFVPNLAGTYAVTQQINIGLPAGIQQDIQDVQIGIGIFCAVDSTSSFCTGNGLTIATDVIDILTNMNVVSNWTFVQNSDGSYTGTVTWTQLQGFDIPQTVIGGVPTSFVQGTFTATVSGEGTITYKDYALTIQFGDMVCFILDQELGTTNSTLQALEPTINTAITDLVGNFISPLLFTGDGAVASDPTTGIATSITGDLNGSLTISAIPWTHAFTTDYTATPTP